MHRKRLWLRIILLSGASAGAALGGDWQATASGGFGKYRYVSLSSTSGTGDAGIGARYVLDAAIGRALGEHLAMEGAWTFQDGDFEIRSGGQKTAFDAHAHSFHGDFYYYWRGRSVRLRPFVEGGAGVKLYQGIEDVRPRPLAAFGSFAHATDARALLVVGGGVDWKLSSHWAVRIAVRDFATPFPSSVIVPAAGVSAGGWLHDAVVTAGIQVR
jgi:hypothetical protein